jgi:hypothetical protein
MYRLKASILVMLSVFRSRGFTTEANKGSIKTTYLYFQLHLRISLVGV